MWTTAAALLLVLASATISLGQIELRKIGDPSFDVTVVSGSAPLAASPQNFQRAWEVFEEILDPALLIVENGANATAANAEGRVNYLINPAEERPGEYIRRHFANSGYVNTDVFLTRDIFGSVDQHFTILGITSADTEAIPEDVFPIRVSSIHQLHNSRQVHGDRQYVDVPSADSLGVVRDWRGNEHDLSDQETTHFALPWAWFGATPTEKIAVGEFEWKERLLDANGNGWDVIRTINAVSHATDVAGDLNYNGELDSHDLNILTQNVAVAPTDGRTLSDDFLRLDLNGDESVDVSDVHHWVTDLKSTLVGDTNLDGEVQFDDFLALSANFGQAGGWAEGDFDADERVDFSDFLALSANFGGAAPAAVSSVPEPTAASIALFGLLGLVGFRKRR